MTSKDALRTRLASRRDALDAATRAEYSSRIVSHLREKLDSVDAALVASYAAFRSEASLSQFHLEWLAAGRKLALPRVVDDETLDLVEVDTSSLGELVPGRFGILEPVGAASKLETIDAVLVPGLGFDARGGRVGYGAGYYDRLLARIRALPGGDSVSFVGVAFGVQALDEVPIDPHDVPLDCVITEEGLLGT